MGKCSQLKFGKTVWYINWWKILMLKGPRKFNMRHYFQLTKSFDFWWPSPLVLNFSQLKLENILKFLYLNDQSNIDTCTRIWCAFDFTNSYMLLYTVFNVDTCQKHITKTQIIYKITQTLPSVGNIGLFMKYLFSHL